MKVQWTKSALDDLVDIRLHIAQHRPDAAADVAGHILDSVEAILDFPRIGKTGRMKGTQEVVVPGTPYMIVYRSSSARIQLLRVLHGRRLWPPRPKKRR